jgi:hypothetical protein
MSRLSSRMSAVSIAFCGLGLMAAITVFAFAGPGRQQGVLLSEASLSRIFGDDSTNMTCKAFTCKQGFGDASNCSYCKITGAKHVCCPGGEKSCDYDGTLECPGAPNFTGDTVAHLVGSCGTCNFTNDNRNGNCGNNGWVSCLH